jgi:predicted DsbA family dithiol-disulfide isomerase
VRTDIVEAGEFPDLVQRYSVYAVPKTVINDAAEVLGAVPEAALVDALAKAVRPRTGSGEGRPADPPG